MIGSPKQSRTSRRRQSPQFRAGLSLLEVIACTILVTFLMVPIAGVIRASAQAIERTTADGTLESQARRSLRWLTVKLDVPMDGPVSVSRRGDAFRFISQGQTTTVSVQSQQLIWENSTTRTRIVLAENVTGFGVSPRDSNGVTLGLDIKIELTDPSDRSAHSVYTTAALQ